MKLVQVEDVSPVLKRLTVEVEAETVARTVEKTYQRLSKQVNLKGFRPGKAPRAVLERYYGDTIKSEVTGQLMSESFQQAVDESGLKPVTEPQVEPGGLDPQAAFTYTINLEITPQIEVEGYFGLDLVRREREINETMIQLKLEELRQIHATLEAAPEDRAAEAGDCVLADIEATREGRPVRGGQLTNFDIFLGQGRFHAEVEQALVGIAAGQERNVKAEFPKDFFHDGLAGREVDLKITCRQVKQTVLPELNDDFAKSLGGNFESLDQLKERIREELGKAAEKESERGLQDQLLDKLLEKVEFEAPAGLVDLEVDRMVAQVQRSLGYRGVNLQQAGIFEDKLRADLNKQAVRRVKEDLLLEAIANREGLNISEAELKDGFQELAGATGQNPEEIERFHQERDLVEPYRRGLLRRKTLKELLAQATIQVEKVSDQGEAEAKPEAGSETGPQPEGERQDDGAADR